MTEPLLPTALLIDALRVAHAAANKIANPFLIYLIEMAVLEVEHVKHTQRLHDHVSEFSTENT